MNSDKRIAKVDYHKIEFPIFYYDVRDAKLNVKSDTDVDIPNDAHVFDGYPSIVTNTGLPYAPTHASFNKMLLRVYDRVCAKPLIKNEKQKEYDEYNKSLYGTNYKPPDVIKDHARRIKSSKNESDYEYASNSDFTLTDETTSHLPLHLVTVVPVPIIRYLLIRLLNINAITRLTSMIVNPVVVVTTVIVIMTPKTRAVLNNLVV